MSRHESDTGAVFVSAIIPTVGRRSLGRAVESVTSESLDLADLEVIVVNDSGNALSPETWQSDPRVHLLHTNRVERSAARNVGVARARGRYLLFLDDDDVLMPGALQVFKSLAHDAPGACWLHGAYESVDNDGQPVARFTPRLGDHALAALVSSEGLPLQASLIRRDQFDSVGGFDLTQVGTEDRDLGRRLAAVGTIAGTSTPVARIRVGREGSTTNWDRLAEQDRRGRETAFAIPGIDALIRRSAHAPYWRGRVVRAYLASAAWNVRSLRLATAAARVRSSIGCTLGFAHRAHFWKGVAGRPEHTEDAGRHGTQPCP